MLEHSRGVNRLRVLLIALLLAGCDTGPMPVPLDGTRRDGGPRDAGERMDAPPMDSGPDAGRDGSRPRDAGPPTCVADPERAIKLGQDPDRSDRVVALAAAGTGFGIAWNEVPTGGALSEIHAAFLSSAGVLGAEQRVTENVTPERPPTLAAVGTQWIVGWVDNASGTFEVRSRQLGADLAPVGTIHPVSDTPTAREDNPALFVGSAGPLLAWVEDEMATGDRTARARPLALDGTPMGTAGTASGAGRRPGQLALGELEAGPVLLWSDGIAGSGEVYLQGLTSAGATRGSATPISTEANADGSVDAALFPTGGAVVFGVLVAGVRHEVRFRALDRNGALLRDERILANGTDASITPFAGGYAVSYRSLPSGETPAQIRLLLVDSFGDVVDDQVVIPTVRGGGRTTIRASADGQLAIAWAEAVSAGTDVKVALVSCGAP